MLAGLAISPQTPSSSITDEAFHAADMILIMTVHPGAGGQKFMPECLEKARELRKRFNGVEKHIQVDGGVGPGNICDCAKAGEFDNDTHHLTWHDIMLLSIRFWPPHNSSS
jgi:ribulose-phosphate 3-epimerase